METYDISKDIKSRDDEITEIYAQHNHLYFIAMKARNRTRNAKEM